MAANEVPFWPAPYQFPYSEYGSDAQPVFFDPSLGKVIAVRNLNPQPAKAGTGDYTITFDDVFPDINGLYCVVTTRGTANDATIASASMASKSQISVKTFDTGTSAAADKSGFYFALFRYNIFLFGGSVNESGAFDYTAPS